jgi:hypothetical protein
LKHLCIVEKIFSRAVKYYPSIFKKRSFEKAMRVESFGTIRVPILGVPRKSDIWM